MGKGVLAMAGTLHGQRQANALMLKERKSVCLAHADVSGYSERLSQVAVAVDLLVLHVLADISEQGV
jgi:hypothetical protein